MLKKTARLLLLTCSIVSFASKQNHGFFNSLSHIFQSSKPMALSDQNTNSAKVWGKKIALNLYSLSATNYQNKLLYLSHFFTKQSWKNLQEALEASQLLDIIKTENYHLSAQIDGPTTSAPMVTRGLKGFILVVPLRVMFQNRKFKQFQTLNIQLHVIHNQHNKRSPFLVSFFNAKLKSQSQLIEKHPACKISNRKSS